MRLYFCKKCGLCFFRNQDRVGVCQVCGEGLRMILFKVTLPVHMHAEHVYEDRP